jgi:hypothetical protein
VRFKCLYCGKTFGEQTIPLDYIAKRKLSYQRIFEHLTNCGGIRATARIMGVNHSAITNRIGRMARQAIALQAELLSGFVNGRKTNRGRQGRNRENWDIPPKIGRNPRSVTNSLTMSVFKILQTVPIDQNKPIIN